MTKKIFQLQCLNVIENPEELPWIMLDPRMVKLFRRIMKGAHDCALCDATLNLDADSLASPGVLGFVHGDFGTGIDAVAVAACVACTLKLGGEGVSRAIGQEFVDTCAGGGTVTLVQGGTA